MITKTTWPRLYALASTGKVKIWDIFAEGDPKSLTQPAIYTITHGYADQDPEKHQSTTHNITKGKNVGRSNATTPYQQACSEAESHWKKKLDKAYTTDPSGESALLLPMLALHYEDRKHNLVYPCWTQPKLEGVRCLAKKVSGTEMQYLSRGGKEYKTLEHLTPFLLDTLEVGQVLDGEIYRHGWDQQTINSAVKGVKEHKVDPTQLQYWVYDIVDTEKPFNERFPLFETLIGDALGRLVKAGGREYYLRPVHSLIANSEEEILARHKVYVSRGFEGTIVRNSAGKYRCNYRSADLLKHKDQQDAEFVIVGAKDGIGKDEGKVTWICGLPNGQTFDARPMGTDEMRRHWFENAQEFFGQDLTVRFQHYSQDGVPIYPRGVAIRPKGM